MLFRLLVQREISVRDLSINREDLFGALLAFLVERYPQIPYEESDLFGWSIVWQRLLFAGCLRAREFFQLQQSYKILGEIAVGEPTQKKHLENLLSIISAQLEEVDAARALVPLASSLVDEVVESPDPARSLSALQQALGLGAASSFLGADLPHLCRAFVRLAGLNEALADTIALSARALPRPFERRSARIWQQEQQSLALLRWLSDALTISQLQRAFTDIAEEIVSAAWGAALDDMPEAPSMALLGMGSLGAREMLYLSDVDLVFLYDGAEQERCIQVAQRVISLLSSKEDGPCLYEVDTRLRPLGTQGPLVSSLEHWARYYGLIESDEPRAHLWEEQALLRARVIAGEQRVCASFEALLEKVLARPIDAEYAATELRKMRQKIEQETGRARSFHYKASTGGLFDIDFIAQFLQLTHRDKEYQARDTNTAAILSSLVTHGALASSDESMLQGSRDKLLRLLLCTRLITEKTLDVVPENPDALRRLLRSQQLSFDDLLPGYLEPLRGQVRACFDRIVSNIN